MRQRPTRHAHIDHDHPHPIQRWSHSASSPRDAWRSVRSLSHRGYRQGITIDSLGFGNAQPYGRPVTCRHNALPCPAHQALHRDYVSWKPTLQPASDRYDSQSSLAGSSAKSAVSTTSRTPVALGETHCGFSCRIAFARCLERSRAVPSASSAAACLHTRLHASAIQSGVRERYGGFVSAQAR